MGAGTLSPKKRPLMRPLCDASMTNRQIHTLDSRVLQRLTSWPMGMADRGSMFPGRMVLDAPERIWSPGNTPWGARMYENPLKSPPEDPATSATSSAPH